MPPKNNLSVYNLKEFAVDDCLSFHSWGKRQKVPITCCDSLKLSAKTESLLLKTRPSVKRGVNG